MPNLALGSLAYFAYYSLADIMGCSLASLADSLTHIPCGTDTKGRLVLSTV